MSKVTIAMDNISKVISETIPLRKNGIHPFLDPECPNWISTNQLGADIVVNLKDVPYEIATFYC